VIEFFRDACAALRCGGELSTQALQQVRQQLWQRKRQALAQLAAELPQVYQALLGPTEQALDSLLEAVDALELAASEDSPEMASWISLKAQEADEVLRSVQQRLSEHSQMLAEEQ